MITLPGSVKLQVVPAPVVGGTSLCIRPGDLPVVIGGCPLVLYIAAQLLAGTPPNERKASESIAHAKLLVEEYNRQTGGVE